MGSLAVCRSIPTNLPRCVGFASVGCAIETPGLTDNDAVLTLPFFQCVPVAVPSPVPPSHLRLAGTRCICTRRRVVCCGSMDVRKYRRSSRCWVTLVNAENV